MGIFNIHLPKKVDNAIGAIGRGAVRTVAQVNPLDNGRTWQHTAPVNSLSAMQQLTHNGASNIVGQVAKPIIRSGMALNQGIGNLELKIGGRQTQNASQYANSIDPRLQKFTGYTGTKGQIAGDLVNTAATVAMPGSSTITKNAFRAVAPKFVPDIANRALANAGVGAVGGAINNASFAAGNNQIYSLNDLKNSALTGAKFGAALGAGGTLAAPVVKAGGRVTVKGAKAYNDNLSLPALEGKIAANTEARNQNIANREAAQLRGDNRGVRVLDKQHADLLHENNKLQKIYSFQSKGIGGSTKKVSTQPPDFLQTSPEYAATHPPRQSDAMALADLSPKEQMALNEVKISLAPKDINTGKNPFKSPIPEVKQGDYKQIISNEQAASNPAMVAGNRWQIAMEKLKKSNPDEFKNFWRHVEDPKSAKSPELQQAVAAWRRVDDRIHGTSQQLGGNTNYLTNHGLHPWNLPDDLAKHLINGGDIQKFAGLNSLSRKYRTIAEGEAKGLQLGDNPLQEGSKYIQASAGSLRRRAIIKGLGEADGHIQDKTHYLDMGGGETIPMSKEAHDALRGLQKERYSTNKAAVSVRTVNQGLKTSILSAGQFHPVNISLMRAGPSLALSGHPIMAVKGMAGTFSATKGRVGKMYEGALTDTIKDPGTGQALSYVDAAAKIGSPYAQKGYETAGSALKSGVGHKLVFEQQIPMMHNQVVRGVINDLIKKGVPLDSNEARQAGIAANSTMGFINKEALNIPTSVRKGMHDWMLASQFTPSKIVTLSKVGKGGVAGKYARADVASNVAAATAIIAGVGYLLGQKQDSIRDSLLRALVNPAVPSSQKDSKGNDVEYRIPLTYTGEISHLLGIKLKRQADGHLGIDWKPGNAPGTVTDWMRSRLSPLPSTAVKLATNTNFSSKPLYDPSAPAGTKAIQSATTIGQGFLPIGTQGALNTKVVKEHLPGSAQAVLDANTPGSNPLLKSGLSSVGFSPRADQTKGKGLTSAQYFSALDTAKHGLNGHEKAALELYAGNKKNPVTGKYDVQPNVNDTSAKAKALLDQPKVIDHLIAMNASLKKQGQKVDPLWLSSKDQVTKVLQYQAMPPGGADRSRWYKQNADWYGPLSDQRTAFFNGLPKGDPNKPSAPIEFPNASSSVAAKQEQFFNLSDSKERAAFIRDNPDVQKQLDAQVDYNNKMRVAQGYGALDTFPSATPQVQKIIDTYNAIPKGGGKRGGNKYRSQWIQAHPKEYAAMQQYFTQVSLYGLEKDAGQAQYQDTGFSQKGLKDIYSLGQYDIGKQTDANGNTFYALGGNTDSSSGSGGYGSYAKGSKTPNTAKYLKSYGVAKSKKLGRSVRVSKVSARARGTTGGKITVRSKKIRLA